MLITEPGPTHPDAGRHSYLLRLLYCHSQGPKSERKIGVQ